MTSKNTTLLRHGIHSELFLLAFDHPDTGYKIAQRHQDTTKRPDTSKTSKALAKLEKSGYLYLKYRKYYPNISRLSSELLQYVESQGIELDDNDSKLIKEMLEQNSFFMVLGLDVLSRILSQPPRIHHIDALQVISNHIGMLCTFHLIPRRKGEKVVTDRAKRKTVSKISKELDEDASKINKQMEKSLKGSKSVRKKKMESVNTYGNLMKSLILGNKILDKATISTLEKLGKLWEQHDGFRIGFFTSEKIG